MINFKKFGKQVIYPASKVTFNEVAFGLRNNVSIRKALETFPSKGDAQVRLTLLKRTIRRVTIRQVARVSRDPPSLSLDLNTVGLCDK